MKVGVVFLVLLSCLAAQDQTTLKPVEKGSKAQAAAPPSPAAKAAAETGMPKPAPEIERLRTMLQGRWTTEEKHEPNEFVPQGGTGKGSESVRPGPGGLSIIAEYTSQGPTGQFAGIGIFTWNAAQKAYELHWTDNTNPAMTMMTGKWEGENLVFSGTDTFMGKKLHSRHMFTEIKPNAFTYTIDMGPAANQLKRALTVSYTRWDRNREFRQRLEQMRGPGPQ